MISPSGTGYLSTVWTSTHPYGKICRLTPPHPPTRPPALASAKHPLIITDPASTPSAQSPNQPAIIQLTNSSSTSCNSKESLAVKLTRQGQVRHSRSLQYLEDSAESRLDQDGGRFSSPPHTSQCRGCCPRGPGITQTRKTMCRSVQSISFHPAFCNLLCECQHRVALRLHEVTHRHKERVGALCSVNDNAT